MTTDQCRELLNEFLRRWPIDKVSKLTLEDYVGLGDKDTFCRWTQIRTRFLGSINGMYHINFGIYERKNPAEKPKNYKNDDNYSWLKSYGDNRSTVFENIKRDIVKVIQLSEAGNFEQINDVQLPDMFKWKIAFLYSNERLIPIYNRRLLFKIAKHFGFPTSRNTPISDIQKVMMQEKPADLDVYEFMRKLCSQFDRN